jgi:mRNA interferase HicA
MNLENISRAVHSFYQRAAWNGPGKKVPASGTAERGLTTQHMCCTLKSVTSAEFKRWLERLGCTFEPAKGSHLKVRLGERSAIIPMHGKREIGKGLENAIKKQLGLK